MCRPLKSRYLPLSITIAAVCLVLAICAKGKIFCFSSALLLGIIQGLTEFLPISSTAHLLLAEIVLNIDHCQTNGIFQPTEMLCAFDVILQIGTVLAAFVFFRKDIATLLRQAKREKKLQKNPLWIIFCAFLPVGIVGFCVRHYIDRLYQIQVIACALIFGGVLIFLGERLAFSKKQHHYDGISNVVPSLNQAIKIGFWQCLSLIPGTSRSMSTIVGGYSCGLNREVAVKFSFLLGLVTSAVATIYKLISSATIIFHYFSLGTILAGVLSSAVVAFIVIKPFIRYLIQHGLTIFGHYRIFLALCIFLIQ